MRLDSSSRPRSTRNNPQKLLFLHPKTLIDSWPTPVDLLGEFIKTPALVYPLLAAIVEDLPFDVEILDGYVTWEPYYEYKKRLCRADIVCITVATPLKTLNTELTVRLIRRLNPRATIVLGGNHASSFPERWIEKGADYVIVKDGERAWRLLAERLAAGETDVSDVPNLVYRGKGGEPVRTSTVLVTEDLDATPIPLWEAFDLKPFRAGLGFGGLAASVEVSRGCPYRCDFCNINRYWDYNQRYKSVDRVIAEMDRLHRLGVRQFIFADDNFAQDVKHTSALFEKMIERKYGFQFGCFLRASTVENNPGFAELAGRAGMRIALMGLESVDEAWLKEHRKGLKTDDAKATYARVYQHLHRGGVTVFGLFIDPGGTPSGYSGSGADGTICDIHVSADLVAQRGSLLYDNLVKEKRVTKDMFYHDWNMPSMREPDGSLPVREGFAYWAGSMKGTSLRHVLRGGPTTRRFWGSAIGVVAERMLMSRPSDIQRFRWAIDPNIDPAERQKKIVESVLNDDVLDRLVNATFWKSPLSLRTGF